MSTRREIRDYLNDILESIANIREFTTGMTCPEFIADKKTSLAVIRCLEIIGEAAKKIPPICALSIRIFPGQRLPACATN